MREMFVIIMLLGLFISASIKDIKDTEKEKQLCASKGLVTIQSDGGKFYCVAKELLK